MMIYTGEEDDETLAKLGIELADDEDVDDATVGFCEMMSVKIGSHTMPGPPTAFLACTLLTDGAAAPRVLLPHMAGRSRSASSSTSHATCASKRTPR
jgi:hypothetical protein